MRGVTSGASMVPSALHRKSRKDTSKAVRVMSIRLEGC